MEKIYKLSRKEFGLRLAKLREHQGVSARQMSLDIGQNKNYITAIEAGNNYPTMNNFFTICEYLYITPERFFQISDTKSILQEDLIQIISELSGEKCQHLFLLARDLHENAKQ